ncbi:MAG: 50S ribosomal protein L17 [Candidatus Omnitrophota bacterium]|nr:50S ribosomal protein L17 [Candidatus Omnitrophota bacterium]
MAFEQRKALLRNMVQSLVRHKRIRTTLIRAKVASAFADRMVELAKKGTLHARRLMISRLGSPDAARSLINDIAPHFKDRQGGYTRVIKIDNRIGDNARMALLEFTAVIDVPRKKSKPKKSKKKMESAAEVSDSPEPREKTPKVDAKKKQQPTEEKESEDKKETQKRGGFLGSLRKFLKGDE